MYVYILSGKLFGKNIYEISYTHDINKRLLSDIYNFPDKNKILFKKEILFLNDVNLIKKIIFQNFSKYHMKGDGNFYKIELEKAINILNFVIDMYDKKPEIIEKPKTTRFCFSI